MWLFRSKIKTAEVVSESDLLDFSAKKVRRLYGIKHENWFTAKKITQTAYSKSESKFQNLADLDEADFTGIATCLEESREFIQINFRTEDPSTHVNKLKIFWQKPNGLHNLNIWFEWLVGGSDRGNIMLVIEENMDQNMIIIERVLMEKNSEEYAKQLKYAKMSLMEKFGNMTMYYIHLMRELAKMWQNDPEKILYVEGEDSLQNISSQPYLHIVCVNQSGVADHVWKLLISVRVGGTIVFDDVTLGQGLAAILQVTFAFNLLYEKSVDDIYNFVQRILAKFGPADGARNDKNKLKKNFLDFLCILGKIVVESEKGNRGISSLL